MHVVAVQYTVSRVNAEYTLLIRFYLSTIITATDVRTIPSLDCYTLWGSTVFVHVQHIVRFPVFYLDFDVKEVRIRSER